MSRTKMPLQIGTHCPNTRDMEADSDITSFRAVIDLWPSREALTSDIDCVDSSRVRKWWQRNNIPSNWWARVLATDKAKSAGLTTDLFASLAAKVEEARA